VILNVMCGLGVFEGRFSLEKRGGSVWSHGHEIGRDRERDGRRGRSAC